MIRSWWYSEFRYKQLLSKGIYKVVWKIFPKLIRINLSLYELMFVRTWVRTNQSPYEPCMVNGRERGLKSSNFDRVFILPYEHFLRTCTVSSLTEHRYELRVLLLFISLRVICSNTKFFIVYIIIVIILRIGLSKFQRISSVKSH